MTSETLNSTGRECATADAVVIGAGLSGLQAAVDIQAAGFSCLVVEANDRVGGKTLSIKSSSKPTGVNDLGAAWVNDSNQSEIWKLFEKYNVGAVIQRATGSTLQQAEDGSVASYPYGNSPGVANDDQAKEFRQIFAAIQEAVNATDLEHPEIGSNAQKLDNMTFAEFCQGVAPNTGAAVASMATASLLGVEAREVSALYMVNYIKSGCGLKVILSDRKDGAQYIRGRRGMQAISEGLASELIHGSVYLNTVVKSIQLGDDGLYKVLSTTGTSLRAKYAVVSVPTSLYHTIEFAPPLPEKKRRLGASTFLGDYSKVVLVFDKPWWHAANLSGIMNSYKGPISFTRDTSVPEDDQWSISCFIVGDMGRAWRTSSEASRRDAVLEQFNSVFSTVAAVPKPIAIHERIWAEEPYFFGAPSPVMGPGMLKSLGSDVLREPAGNIHFVGTETSVVWKGYMDGAIRSGQRGAKEVIASLTG